MAEYVSKAELREFANKISLTEQRELRKRAETANVKGTTFLSHSSKDDDLVVGAIRLIEGHGGTVYVDRKDPTMPPYTTEATADLLRKRIQQCDKFVLLATPNSKASKWVPWELGLSDGYKGPPKIAILPTADPEEGEEWASWEYMGLYNKIAWGNWRERKAISGWSEMRRIGLP